MKNIPRFLEIFVNMSYKLWLFFRSFKFLAAPDAKTNNDAIIVLLVEFLPSLTITALNGIVPLIFGLVVKAENYTPEFTIKITLIR